MNEHMCEFENCGKPGSVACYINPSDAPSEYYCPSHATAKGYCPNCGDYITETRDDDSDLCELCQVSEDYIDDYDEDEDDDDYWGYPDGWYDDDIGTLDDEYAETYIGPSEPVCRHCAEHFERPDGPALMLQCPHCGGWTETGAAWMLDNHYADVLPMPAYT